MEGKLFVIDKKYFLPIIILVPINVVIFITPIRISLLTSQYLLLISYIILFFTATLGPSLSIFGLVKKHVPSLILFSLLILVPLILNLSNNVVTNKTERNYEAKQISEGTELEIKNIKSAEDLLAKNFCFKIYLPEYLPTSPYKMYFYDAIGSVKKCDNQVASVLYNPYNMNITEVPRNYDFEFRKGFEDLKGLRSKALSGKKVVLNGQDAYMTDIRDIFEGFRPPPAAVSREPTKLLYLETEGTLIFLKFVPNEVYSEDTYFKIAESLKPIN